MIDRHSLLALRVNLPLVLENFEGSVQEDVFDEVTCARFFDFYSWTSTFPQIFDARVISRVLSFARCLTPGLEGVVREKVVLVREVR